jgi:hypothetical protein
MQTITFTRILTMAAAAVVVFTSLCPVEACARGGSRTVTGSRGGVRHQQVSHTPGKFSASGSASLPNGKTASRSVVSQQTDMGRTTSAQRTGFNGKTATYDSNRTKTDSGYTRQIHASGKNGSTATKQVDVSKQDGTITRSVVTTTTPPTP